jgi:hypothetical protein
MVVLSAVCSFIAYLLGTAIEIRPTVNLPGFGIALALITMGSFILFQLKRNKN